jgi:hypothetical protein
LLVEFKYRLFKLLHNNNNIFSGLIQIESIHAYDI